MSYVSEHACCMSRLSNSNLLVRPNLRPKDFRFAATTTSDLTYASPTHHVRITYSPCTELLQLLKRLSLSDSHSLLRSCLLGGEVAPLEATLSLN